MGSVLIYHLFCSFWETTGTAPKHVGLLGIMCCDYIAVHHINEDRLKRKKPFRTEDDVRKPSSLIFTAQRFSQEKYNLKLKDFTQLKLLLKKIQNFYT